MKMKIALFSDSGKSSKDCLPVAFISNFSLNCLIVHKGRERRESFNPPTFLDAEPPQMYNLSFSGTERLSPVVALSSYTLNLLLKFDVDPIRGFLPHDDPLLRLPQPELQQWENLVSDLPALIISSQIRNVITRLPILPIFGLETESHRRRALLVLCMLCHAYIWGDPLNPSDILPENIAVPLWELAESMNVPPLMAHLSLVLYNWRRLDISGPIEIKNLATSCQFLGGQDESWFYLTTVEIEARGGAAMGTLIEAQFLISEVANFIQTDKCMPPTILEKLCLCLKAVEGAVSEMLNSLRRMSAGCDPRIFYHRVRPFLSGWKANPTLPSGVMYAGTKGNQRCQFYGGSAAQSSLFAALDAALGIAHENGKSSSFLKDMRIYMPPRHKAFLEHLENPGTMSIREFAQFLSKSPDQTSCANDVVRAYDATIKAVEAFRTAHIGIVTAYILQQQSRVKVDFDTTQGSPQYTREKAAGGKGTGGTDLLEFLRPLRDDTKLAALLN